jgi:hypothetical protein
MCRVGCATNDGWLRGASHCLLRCFLAAALTLHHPRVSNSSSQDLHLTPLQGATAPMQDNAAGHWQSSDWHTLIHDVSGGPLLDLLEACNCWDDIHMEAGSPGKWTPAVLLLAAAARHHAPFSWPTSPWQVAACDRALDSLTCTLQACPAPPFKDHPQDSTALVNQIGCLLDCICISSASASAADTNLPDVSLAGLDTDWREHAHQPVASSVLNAISKLCCTRANTDDACTPALDGFTLPVLPQTLQWALTCAPFEAIKAALPLLLQQPGAVNGMLAPALATQHGLSAVSAIVATSVHDRCVDNVHEAWQLVLLVLQSCGASLQYSIMCAVHQNLTKSTGMFV